MPGDEWCELCDDGIWSDGVAELVYLDVWSRKHQSGSSCHCSMVMGGLSILEAGRLGKDPVSCNRLYLADYANEQPDGHMMGMLAGLLQGVLFHKLLPGLVPK